MAQRNWLRLLHAAERGEVCIGGGRPKNQAEVDRMKLEIVCAYEENNSCVADLKPSHAYDPDGALSLLCSTNNVIGDGDEPPAKKICKEGLLPVY